MHDGHEEHAHRCAGRQLGRRRVLRHGIATILQDALDLHGAAGCIGVQIHVGHVDTIDRIKQHCGGRRTECGGDRTTERHSLVRCVVGGEIGDLQFDAIQRDLIGLAWIDAARQEMLNERRTLRDQFIRWQTLIQRDVIDPQRDDTKFTAVRCGDAGTDIGQFEVAGRVARSDREAEVARRVPGVLASWPAANIQLHTRIEVAAIDINHHAIIATRRREGNDIGHGAEGRLS